MNWPLKIQGRVISEAHVNEINSLLSNNPLWHRTRLSKELCIRWNWKRVDGQMKDMACRELLRKLDLRTLIKLPPSQIKKKRNPPVIKSVALDKQLISCILSDIQPVRILNIRDYPDYENVFNYLLNKYHYLSFSRPVGQNMKYILLNRNERFLGCLLFGAAAWKTEARDRWIGWSPELREKNLGLICNNTRFLILDWINIPHLASHVLGRCLRCLTSDWKKWYGTEILMVETFVDTTRFKGTCYKAANWKKIGQTKGRSRQDCDRKIQVPIKDIFVYPLPNFNTLKNM